MRREPYRPVARASGLVVKAEVLVYDLERHRAHCLSPSRGHGAAAVFQPAGEPAERTVGGAGASRGS